MRIIYVVLGVPAKCKMNDALSNCQLFIDIYYFKHSSALFEVRSEIYWKLLRLHSTR